MSNFLLAPSSYKKKRGKKLASRRVFSSEKSPLQGVRGLSFEEALDAVLPPSSPPRTSGVSIFGSNTGGQNLAARASSVPQSTGPLMPDRFGSVQDDDGYGPRAEFR